MKYNGGTPKMYNSDYAEAAHLLLKLAEALSEAKTACTQQDEKQYRAALVRITYVVADLNVLKSKYVETKPPTLVDGNSNQSSSMGF